MATTPMLQGVLLFQHHQTTTPNLPGAAPAATASGIQAPEAIAAMAKPKQDKTVDDPPFDTEENGENDNDDDEEEESGEEKNG